HLLEGCQIVGFDWRYLYVNDALVKQSRRRRDELLGRTMMEAYPGIEKAPFFGALRECMRRRRPQTLENEFEFPDGSVGWFELHFEPVPEGVLVLSIDISARYRAESERARLEAQFRQAQKMEAVGRLAGGVAHDFNNLLSVILGYAEVAMARDGLDDATRADVAEIRRAGESAAALTRQLLAFSRQQVLSPVVLDLNAVVAPLEPMLARLLGEDVVVRLRLAPALGRVEADAHQIEQVVMNLAVNSRDAMPDGGHLTIETADVELDAAYAEQHVGVEPGHYVMLAISDDGHGMDAATRERLFEPFFTTKEAGKGTGLGLATVYGIVKQSGGHIWIYSESGQGTTFRIYLPRTDGAAPAVVARPPAAPRGGDETVLVVEDQEALRQLLGRLLSAAGYRVLTASNGAEALALSAAHAGAVDLVLTDVVMPEMGGLELMARLRERHPELRVLFMSGYTEETVARHGVLDPARNFLGKPFTAAELARRVRTLLDG
ncbi:MAG: response regulator, partial [Thermoanaerobaculia bacterium]|nr:response regulator [Thermoanaerobaculia bacterium]